MRNSTTIRKLAIRGQFNRRWYRHARIALHRIAGWNGWNYGRFVDVLSITSPRVSVRRNLRFTLSIMGGHGLPSDAIRSTGIALAHYESTGIIRGPKTSRFAQVLRGDDSPVVLDSWMAKALDVDALKIGNVSVRKPAEARIRRVAADLDWTPAECQAAVWAGIIRSVGYNVPRFDIVDAVPF